jgi:hypothetical protein
VVQFITPPSQLVEKTGRPVPGLGATVLRRANAAHKRHIEATDYHKVVEPSLAMLSDSLGQLRTTPTSSHAARQIYNTAHNLKGEGGSFGYHAVSSVASLLCRVTEEPDRSHPRRVVVVSVHVDSLKAMVRYDIKGEPSGLALEVISALSSLVDLYLGPWSLMN